MDADKKSFAKMLGRNIRYYREAKGWTQEELSRRCGYTSENSRSTIQKIEVGANDVPSSKLKIIADALGITPGALMECDDVGGYSIPPPVLSAQEGTLISNFRSLSDQGREYVLQQVDMAVRVYKKYSGVPVLEGEA